MPLRELQRKDDSLHVCATIGRAALRSRQGLSDPRQPRALEPPVVDTLLKVDAHRSQRRQGAPPVEARIS